MAVLMHLPISIEADHAAGLAVIRQRFGDHKDDTITIEISRDQAIQVADFLMKSFKVKKSELVQGSADGFDKFWAAYPSKEAKQTALSIWKRDNCSTVVDHILADVERRKNTKQWIDGYVPHPTTYLRQKRYLDDPAESSESTPWDDAL